VIKDHLVFMVATKYTEVGDNIVIHRVSVLRLLLTLSKHTRVQLLFVSINEVIMSTLL